MKIPYGESDFRTVAMEGYFYQDRTRYIEELERWNSKYVVFLRPRRFGKSLFVSMLQHYYGLEHAGDFGALFGHLYIGQHPTPLAGQYLVLRFEFSRIDTSAHERTYQGFLTNTLLGARSFIAAYRQFFSDGEKEFVLSRTSPEAVVKAVFGLVAEKSLPHKLYVLIDEYDHFANELLSFDLGRFKSDVSQNGFVRKFYETFKTAAGEGIVDRIFITGVSPVTLDSLTSGFNISDNLSLNPIFHGMMGFTQEEVAGMLRLAGIAEAEVPGMMADLRAWYNGYAFADHAGQWLFNPDMVLYFLKEYRIMGQYPEVMLDTNVISDYRKVRNIFRIGSEEAARFELLESVVKEGHIDFPLTRLYNLEAEFTDGDFLSLLFYMGLLSFREPAVIGWRFGIPNYVIKKLYFEYFTSILLEKTRFARTQRPIGQSIAAMIGEGNPEPFLRIAEQVLLENHSNRDELSYGEKHLQTLMIGLLFPYESYYIHSEYEARKGYPDIFLEKRPGLPVKYDIVLELKYVKKSAEHLLEETALQAESQLAGYMHSERFARPDVRGVYAVFVGGELRRWGVQAGAGG